MKLIAKLWSNAAKNNDITNQTISQNIEKNALIVILEIHSKKNMQIGVNKNWIQSY